MRRPGLMLIMTAFLLLVSYQSVLAEDGSWSAETEIGGVIPISDVWQVQIGLGYHDGTEWTLQDLALSFHGDNLRFKLGRASMNWGPGEESLILNDRQGFDLLGLGGEWRVWGLPVRWEEFWSGLNDRAGSQRRLLGHRASVQMGRWTLGASETVLLSGDYSPWYYNPIPIWPYYLTQHVLLKHRSSQNTTSNILAQADFAWENEEHDRFYGALMVDDAPGTPPNESVPGRVGLQLGFDAQDIAGSWNLRGEYTGISRYTYTYLAEAGDYIGRETLIGHPLGPDADRLRIELTRPLDKDWSLTLRTDYERHGEGRFGDRWTIADGGGYHFLEGVTETTRRLGLQIGKTWGEDNSFRFLVGYEWTSNVGNLDGTSDQGLYGELGVKIRW